MNIIKHYSNGDVTVVWEPSKCIHSTLCFQGLPQVFNPRERPWIKIEGAGTERIVEQVKACPSGALSYFMNAEGNQETQTTDETVVEVLPNGPLLVYGNLTVRDREGQKTRKTKTTAFCRCGASRHKPFCDGSHVKVGFNDAG
ncbi:MAG: (4Fe-4S)-binding protein [Sphingobacteriaceae bacterium]|nr:(4Fe-4S)-binding protein [Cytophagaceae bacterium]